MVVVDMDQAALSTPKGGAPVLNIDDFICFQTHFAIGDSKADCDASGSLNIDDFICFQTFFGLGC